MAVERQFIAKVEKSLVLRENEKVLELSLECLEEQLKQKPKPGPKHSKEVHYASDIFLLIKYICMAAINAKKVIPTLERLKASAASHDDLVTSLTWVKLEAFTLYSAHEYELAIALLDRFLRFDNQYSKTPSTDYQDDELFCIYLKCLDGLSKSVKGGKDSSKTKIQHLMQVYHFQDLDKKKLLEEYLNPTLETDDSIQDTLPISVVEPIAKEVAVVQPNLKQHDSISKSLSHTRVEVVESNVNSIDAEKAFVSRVMSLWTRDNVWIRWLIYTLGFALVFRNVKKKDWKWLVGRIQRTLKMALTARA